MALYTFTGLSTKVSMASIADFAIYGEMLAKQMVKTMIIVGGFAASKVTLELMEVIKNPIYSDADREEVAEIGLNPYIMVLKDVWDKMPEDERAAVLFHEEAHIVNGDLDNTVQEELLAFESCPNLRLIDSVEKEIKADSYAAARVGKDVMHAALLSVLKIQSELIAERSNGRIVASDLYVDMLEDPNLKTRLSALN